MKKSNSTIEDIHARQILDSRGNPTIEVDVTLKNGIVGRASVPSGASTGSFEAVELRDNNPKYFMGKSVLNAVKNVNLKIAKHLVGKDVLNQEEIDNLMIKLDGTKNKSNLGANAILGVSLACAKAGANFNNQPLFQYIGNNKSNLLPMPMMNILNGGKHSSNNLNIQEFMIVPVSATSFSNALQMCTEVFHSLKKVLSNEGLSTAIGDEGGFAPNLKDDEDALKYILKAIKNAGYSPETDFKIALDVAASEMKNEALKLGKKNHYYFWKTGKMFSQLQFINYLTKLCEKYPIISIEDGLGEEDYEGWKKLNQQLGSKIQLVGDDLFVTNIERLQFGIKQNLANAILIKVNQIGTLTETLQTIKLAKSKGYSCIISHRSGETEDTTIADLAVALNCGQIKTGAPSRTDRVCKYNQLLRIEEQLDKKAKFNIK